MRKILLLSIIMCFMLSYPIYANDYMYEDNSSIPDEIIGSNDDIKIINDSGQTVASYEDGDFDFIIGYGDGYYVVLKVSLGFDESSAKLGVLDSEGNMVIPYYNKEELGDYTTISSEFGNNPDSRIHNTVRYLGKGVFAYVCYFDRKYNNPKQDWIFLNAVDGVKFKIEEIDQVWNPYDWFFANSEEYFYHMFEENNYAIVWSNRHAMILTPQGLWDDDIQDEYEISYISKQSDEGVVFFDELTGLHYYDFETRQRTTIWDNPDQVYYSEDVLDDTKFVGGKAVITLIGMDQEIYYAVVDKYGNVLVSPQKEYPDVDEIIVENQVNIDQGEKNEKNQNLSVVPYTGFDGSVVSSEYVFEDSDRRKIDRSELIDLSQFQLLIARNEIYARHGRMFNMEALSQYFATREWYHPQIPADQFGDNDLSSLELENARLILEVEHEKGIYY